MLFSKDLFLIREDESVFRIDLQIDPTGGSLYQRRASKISSMVEKRFRRYAHEGHISDAVTFPKYDMDTPAVEKLRRKLQIMQALSRSILFAEASSQEVKLALNLRTGERSLWTKQGRLRALERRGSDRAHNHYSIVFYDPSEIDELSKTPSIIEGWRAERAA